MTFFAQGTKEIEGIFDLLGDDEDAITGALAYVLSCSANLLRTFVSDFTAYVGSLSGAELHFQKSERGNGRTDLEIIVPNALHVILEAKRGWQLPSVHQLYGYTLRKSFAASRAPSKVLLTLSEADDRYANLFLTTPINGTGVIHVPRPTLLRTVGKTIARTSKHKEKQLLRELANFLNKTMSKPTLESNQVYVVSLNRNLPAPNWAGTTFIDVVERFHKYFHPVGARWPVTPPNYIGFRYGGVLMAIHHVDEATVTKDLADVAPGRLPSLPVSHPHFLYSLGPAIHPARRVPAGPRVLRSNRIWAALDLLMTSSSITQAMIETKNRREQ